MGYETPNIDSIGADGMLTLRDSKSTGNAVTGKSGSASSLAYNDADNMLYVSHSFGPDHIRSFAVMAGKLTLQPGTRTLLTEVDIPNPDGALQPGVYCTVELQIPRKAPALMVPASAIIFNQNGMQVAVVENGVAHLQKIAITTDYGTEVEVNEGVKDGDKVILQPPANLADGDKVQIVPEPPQATP